MNEKNTLYAVKNNENTLNHEKLYQNCMDFDLPS